MRNPDYATDIKISYNYLDVLSFSLDYNSFVSVELKSKTSLFLARLGFPRLRHNSLGYVQYTTRYKLNNKKLLEIMLKYYIKI